MDIRSKSANETARMVVRDPSGDVMRDENGEVAVVVHGPASKRHANAMAARSNRAIDMMKRRGKTEQTAAQKIAENAEFLADCTSAKQTASEGWGISRMLYRDRMIMHHSFCVLFFHVRKMRHCKWCGEQGERQSHRWHSPSQ